MCFSFEVIGVRKWPGQSRNLLRRHFEHNIRGTYHWYNELYFCKFILHGMNNKLAKFHFLRTNMRGCNIGSKNKKKLLNVKMAHVQASGSWCATEIKNFIFKLCIHMYKIYFLYEFGDGVSTSFRDIKESVCMV